MNGWKSESLKIKSSDFFGVADQLNVTFCSSYILTLKRNTNSDVLISGAWVDAAKMVIKVIGWYNPYFTPSLGNQQLVMDQFWNEDPTELYYT